MRLLVTGAGGLIGSAIVEAALQAGIATTAAGRRRPAALPDAVDFVAADLTEPAQAAGLVASAAPSHLVHTAWETTQPTYWNDPVNLRWVTATAAMADAFGQAGGERFLQLGSCAEYDWATPNGMPRADRPATLYGKAKLAAYRHVEAIAHGRFAAVEARFFFVYGPRENAQRFVPLICRAHRDGVPPRLGSGNVVRDLLYVTDAAEAVVALLADAAPTGVVDVGSGEDVKFADVAVMLAEQAGAPETGLGRLPDRPGDPDRLTPDMRALFATGWRPQVPLSEGLARTFEWWRQEAVQG